MNEQQSMQFAQLSQTSVPDVTVRGKVVACAIALAHVRDLGIPSAPVQDPGAHYVQMVLPPLRQQLSQFNEGVVFDIRFSLEVMRQLWLLRYSACFGARIQMFKPECSFVENFTGASHVMSEDICKVLDAHQVPIGLMAAAVAGYIVEEKAEVGSVV